MSPDTNPPPPITATRTVRPTDGGQRPARRRKSRDNRGDVVFWTSVAWIAVIVFCALFASFLPIQHSDLPSGLPSQGMSLAHPFGTDSIGNDLFSLSIRGARMAMLVSIATVAIGAFIGGLIGMTSGFLHGPVEAVLMWLTDVLIAFPALVLALAVVSFAGASVTSVVLTIAVVGIPGFARLVRALTLTYSEENFVLVAEALGATRGRTMVREILPNVLIPLASYAALGAALAIIAESALAFIGLSSPSTVDWGAMINQGRTQLHLAPQAAFAPMIVLFLTILAFNFIGERLSVKLDPRQVNVG